MPRFVGRPVVIEAHQWDGYLHDLSETFRQAVRGFLPGGLMTIATIDGPKRCAQGDWIVHGPDGAFSIVKAALFEAMYQPLPVVAPAPEPEFAPAAAPARPRLNRKETSHAG